MYNLVDAFNSNNDSYVLTETTFYELTNVIDMSISKSSNKTYKDFMGKLVDNLEIFKGKSIAEIKMQLIPIE